jgi:hypothetical protein
MEDAKPQAAKDVELASLIAALEPDQLISAKEKYHVPRRKLKRSEIVVFWAMRLYLVFMFAVVLYQVWASAR